jgi:pyruvyltransferase
MNNKIINLIYYKDKSKNGNFGDELSKFITKKLLNKNKYKLVFNKNNIDLNLVCIGSYIHCAKDNSYIFGSGVRTENNIENGHKYKNLNICAVRGPLTKKFLEKKNIIVPEIYGDPGLLLPIFYKPKKLTELKNKIGIVPHKSNYNKYLNKIDKNKYFLINPMDKWEHVVIYIISCKYILSSSLHGLIISDAYNIPNIWLDEYKLSEGDFKFKDYFLSIERPYYKIKKIDEFNIEKTYKYNNNLNLNYLINSFPFK